jgi:hypothetical protein
MDIKTLASIATFITSIVALGTLWNATKQRLSANRPDIYIKDKIFKMNIAQSDKLPKFEDKELSIFNIGLGAAKNIKITWELDEEYFIKVKQLDKNNDYHIESSHEVGNRFKSFTIGSGHHLATIINLKNDLINSIDFIVPYKSDSDSFVSFTIPHSIMTLFGIHIELWYKNQDLSEAIEKGFNFEVTYLDIHNKKYKKEFKAKFSVNSILDKEVNGSIEVSS